MGSVDHKQMREREGEGEREKEKKREREREREREKEMSGRERVNGRVRGREKKILLVRIFREDLHFTDPSQITFRT